MYFTRFPLRCVSELRTLPRTSPLLPVRVRKMRRNLMRRNKKTSANQHAPPEPVLGSFILVQGQEGGEEVGVLASVRGRHGALAGSSMEVESAICGGDAGLRFHWSLLWDYPCACRRGARRSGGEEQRRGCSARGHVLDSATFTRIACVLGCCN